MSNVFKVLWTTVASAHLVALGAQAAVYALDDGSVRYPLNASDTSEPRDNWFANEFTALAGANLISQVDFGSFTTAPGSSDLSRVVLYRVTGAGGNPALGATRIYTQNFSPLTGDNTNAFLNHISLTSPVYLNVGDRFLVAVFMVDVIAASPHAVYPFLLDTSRTAEGTYWGRGNPHEFNLDDLSRVRPIDQAFSPGGWAPDPGHVFIRAVGIAVPEPSTLTLGALAAATFALLRRRKHC